MKVECRKSSSVELVSLSVLADDNEVGRQKKEQMQTSDAQIPFVRFNEQTQGLHDITTVFCQQRFTIMNRNVTLNSILLSLL